MNQFLLHKFLERSARRAPQKIALIDGARSFSYRELDKAAERIAAHVAARSKFQDRVILFLPNSFEFVASYFGVLKSGRIAVPCEPSIAQDALRFRVKKMRPALAITREEWIPRLRGILPRTRVVSFDTTNMTNRTNWSHWSNSSNSFASILFTTGTTGEPKGIKVRHKNAAFTALNIVKKLGYSSRTIDINPLPFTHSFGLGNVHAVFAAGGTVALHKNFINLKAILEDIKNRRATSFSATPPIYEMLAGPLAKEFKKCGGSLRLLLTNSAPLAPRTIKKILGLVPRAKFFTYYGLTEASRSTFINYRREGRLTSVGRPAPGVTIAIVRGEVRIKGPNVTTGGWLKTGDLGYFDNDGYLYLTGRTDDVVNVGGNKVYPYEIERVIQRHRGVKEAAVVAAPHPTMGEVPRAVVVANKGYNPVELRKELEKFCRLHLEPFKVPAVWEFRDSLPKTSSGKLQKKALR